MGKTKTILVAIRSLRTTATPKDTWLQINHEAFGTGIEAHPNFHCLKGNDIPLQMWFASMGLDWKQQKKELFELMKDIKKHGVLEQIKIYRDGRINTGHKRASIWLFLGHELIRTEVVPDDTKL